MHFARVIGTQSLSWLLELPYLSFPKIPSGLDSHRKAESSHH
jgi:hypothetical protein